ncbi:MAG TPA: hypothetical protein VM680_05845 [Verrucomicrobiae bacterium]|nr:hypothetical protein [Verrucomicrobiae bacterium]
MALVREGRDLNTGSSSFEENENAAWRAMPIAWDGDEAFAPPLMRRQVGARLLDWNGHGANWVSPLLSNWSGSLNFATDK